MTFHPPVEIVRSLRARLLLAVIVLLLAAGLAGCAASVERVGGQLKAEQSGRVELIDLRAAQAPRPAEIDTSTGRGKRLADSVFDEPPIKAFATALADAFAAHEGGRLPGEPIQVRLLDAVLVQGSAAPVNTTSARAGLGGGADALIGGLVGHMLIQMRENSKAPNPLHVHAELVVQGKPIQCRGYSYWDRDVAVESAWSTAVRRAARACVDAIMAPS